MSNPFKTKSAVFLGKIGEKPKRVDGGSDDKIPDICLVAQTVADKTRSAGAFVVVLGGPLGTSASYAGVPDGASTLLMVLEELIHDLRKEVGVVESALADEVKKGNENVN